MSKPIIQSLWVGDKLSLIEQLSIASFIRNGHEFHLYTYNKLSGVPDGVQLKDANEIIPHKQVLTFNKRSYAIFADWFRWTLLYREGNFWVDTDTICLKPFIFDENIIFGRESVQTVATGVLGFPPNHELCRFMLNCCNNPNLFLPYDSWVKKMKKLTRTILNRGRGHTGWGEAGGPRGFTKALKYFDLLDKAKPYTYFYPIHCLNWDAIFDETLAEDIELFSNTYSIHLWNEVFRSNKGFDKNASFPKNSLFEQLKAKYL